MSESLKVLLIGSRILPFRHPGDKNFWLDFIAELDRLGHTIQVLSVTYERVASPNGFPCRYIKPIPVYLPLREARYSDINRWLAGTNNYASKTLSFTRILRATRDLEHTFHPDVIHFIDNYGPVMATLRAVVRSGPLTISAPTYHRNRPLYDLFLRISFGAFDSIVPFSEAYANRLRQLRVDGARIRMIRWGVNPERFRPPSAIERASARAELGLNPAEFVILWTGFTQQTTLRDLEFALDVALRALAEQPTGLRFVFCFKPAHFKQAYKSFEQPGIKVKGSREEFEAARASSDLFLAPILERTSTAAPPLAWLECLSMGIPILTAAIPGVEEVIVPSKSGFVVETPDEASRCINLVRFDARKQEELHEGAREIVLRKYTVDRAVREHLALWYSLPNLST